MFNRVFTLINAVPHEFIQRLLPHNIEYLTDNEHMLYEQLTRIVPHLRLCTATLQEIINEKAIPLSPEYGPIIKQHEDGTVKHGHLVCHTVSAIVHGKTYTQACTRIQCNACEKRFISMDNFVTHQSCTSENAKGDYMPGRKCPICHNPYLDLSSHTAYVNHINTCGGFYNMSSWRVPRKKHCTEFAPTFCYKCGPNKHVYTDLPTFVKHMETCSAIEPTAKGQKRREFICKECGYVHSSQWNLKQHMEKHKRERAKRKDQNIQKGVCHICEKEMYAHNLPKHKAQHKRVREPVPLTCIACSRDGFFVPVIACPICGANMYRSLLKAHLQKKKTRCGESRHKCKCPKCSVQFFNVDGMIDHLPCEGPNGTNTVAPECERCVFIPTFCFACGPDTHVYTDDRTYTAHIRTCPSLKLLDELVDDCEYLCEKCGLLFDNPLDLPIQVHKCESVYTHYLCEKCGLIFASLWDLRTDVHKCEGVYTH